MVTAQIVYFGPGRFGVQVCGRRVGTLWDTPDEAMSFLKDYLYGAAQ